MSCHATRTARRAGTPAHSDWRRTALALALAAAAPSVFAFTLGPTVPAPNASASTYGSDTSGSYPGHYAFGPITQSGPLAVSVTGSGTYAPNGAGGSGSAHATPGGDVGASSSAAATSDPTLYQSMYDAAAVDSSGNFTSSATVVSNVDPATGLPTLAAGAPVQLRFNVRVDGTMDLGAANYAQAYASPDGFTASSDVSFNFTLNDPQVTGTGEMAGIPLDLISMQGDVSGNDSAWIPNGASNYVPTQDYNIGWSLTSNHGDNLSQYTEVTCDTVTISCPGGRMTKSFDTGILTATLDTFVGHTIYWNGSLDVFNQAYGVGAYANADFSHTLAMNLSPITSGVGLNFAFPQQPLSGPSGVPEPGTLGLLGLALAGLAALRRRLAGGARPA